MNGLLHVSSSPHARSKVTTDKIMFAVLLALAPATLALGNRRLTLCRELTKKHETAWQTTIEDAITRYEQEDPKGECVLVIEGRSQKEIEDEAKAAFEEISIEEHMKRYEDQGIARKEAMKLVAKDRGVTKRDIYQYLLGKES